MTSEAQQLPNRHTARQYWKPLLQAALRRRGIEKLLRKLAAEGKMSEAQALATMISKLRLPVMRKPARHFLKISSGWMMRNGYQAAGERPWKTLSPMKRRAIRDQLILLWWKYGCFGSDEARQCQEFLKIGLGPKSATCAFRILELSGHFDSAAEAQLQAYIQRYEGRKPGSGGEFLIMATGLLIARNSADSVVHRLIQLPIVRQKAEKSLLVSDYISKSLPPAPSQIQKTADMYRILMESDQKIWQELADPERTVAVIGNSPCEKGLGKGTEIDSHDIVIRFNTGTAPQDQVADYGSKTSISVCNFDTLSNALPHKEDLTGAIVTGLDFERYNSQLEKLAALLEGEFPVATIPQNVLNYLIAATGAPPSSGLQLIAALAQKRKSPVSYYGFAFIDQIGPNRTSAHFAKNSSPTHRHNWSSEKALFDVITSTDSMGKTPTLPAIPKRSSHETSEFQPTKFRFEGDHANYHCGSAAVSTHILNTLNRNGVVVKDDNYDVLIVNGEGSMHHDSTAFLKKMSMLKHATETGRKALLVNSLWQDNTNEFDDVLRKLDEIVVREVLSQKELKDKHGIASTVIPDFSFYAPYQKVSVPKNLRHKTLLTDFYSEELCNFAIVNGGKLKTMPFLDMKKLTWNQTVSAIAQSDLLLTGRHHAVYAACRARTPFVAMTGNSHKIEGLLVSAGSRIPVLTSLRDLEETRAWALNNRSAYEDLFDWMETQREWRINIGP